jgi:putative ABC transport system permease protein
MTLLDMVVLGFDNLRRTKLRTTLTTLGVVIGIGALTSMVSFGTGMQKNITEAFKESDLFTSLFVTARPIDMEHVADGGLQEIADAIGEEPVALNDSTVEAIRATPGVEIAFAEISFPVKIRINGKETTTRLQALPAAMGAYRPFNDLMAGSFFRNDSAAVAVVQWESLKRMGILASEEVEQTEEPPSADADSLATLSVHPDSIIGAQVEVVTAVLDPTAVGGGPMGVLLGMGRDPFAEAVTGLTIAGVMKRQSTFTDSKFSGGIFVPVGAAQSIPRLGFSSVWDLLKGTARADTYGSIYVRVKRMADMEPVREALEKAGLNVLSISDQLREIRRAFLIVDSILGAVGTIALIVAALGIANTMVMSILERTREIGIMKAIGASEGAIKMIFFVEAATIGVIGALLGLVLGWGVTRVANLVVNAHLMPEGEMPVSLFYFPIWLILGAIGFSIVISLVAGLYPATRAARIDPVEALRHD